jgi:hypothetical protein
MINNLHITSQTPQSEKNLVETDNLNISNLKSRRCDAGINTRRDIFKLTGNLRVVGPGDPEDPSV